MWGRCELFSYNFLYNNTRFAISTGYILEFSSRIKNIISQVQNVNIVEDNGRCNWIQVNRAINTGICTGNVYIQYGDYLSDTSQFVNILENNYPYVETIVALIFGFLLPVSLCFYSYRKYIKLYIYNNLYRKKFQDGLEKRNEDPKFIKKNIKELIVSRRKGYENIKNSEIVTMFPDYEDYLQNILRNEIEDSFKYCDLCRIRYPLLYQCSDGTYKCGECS